MNRLGRHQAYVPPPPLRRACQIYQVLFVYQTSSTKIKEKMIRQPFSNTGLKKQGACFNAISMKIQ
jgi:hypothetical protein